MNILAKVEKLNPTLQISEIVVTEGDYSVIIGKLGEEDNMHYLIVNTRYGVIEAGSGALSEVSKLLEFCLDRKTTKSIGRDKPQTDMFN